MPGLRFRTQRRPPRLTATVAAAVTATVAAAVTAAVAAAVTAVVVAVATAMVANSTTGRSRSLQARGTTSRRSLSAMRGRHVLMPVRRDHELLVRVFPSGAIVLRLHKRDFTSSGRSDPSGSCTPAAAKAESASWQRT